jgi:hypothetical protein
MENVNYDVFTLAERPDLLGQMNELHSTGWPLFMLFDNVAAKYFGELPKLFPKLQFVLVNKDGNAIACGNAVPFCWDGSLDNLPSGWDDVLSRSVEERIAGIEPDTVSAISIVINPSFRGGNISELMVRSMKNLVRSHGFTKMVAPVRPSLKHKYPLTPIENYIHWQNNDSKPFDPWIRVHLRTNAQIMQVASKSMEIKGSVAQWEDWTGMKFPESGNYIVSEALVPVDINLEKNIGAYTEPNVWINHLL